MGSAAARRLLGLTLALVAALLPVVVEAADWTAGTTAAVAPTARPAGFSYDGADPIAVAFAAEAGAIDRTIESEARRANGGEAHLRPAVDFFAPRGTRPATNAADGARLSEQLRLTERYGAGGVRELADGRVRFYGNTKPAKNPGEMAGARLVREWDPATGAQRTWYETLDHSGNIRSVRPETGGPKVHYIFGPDGTYLGPR